MLCTYIIALALLGYQVQGAVIQNNDNLINALERLSTTIKEKCQNNNVEFKEVLGELTNFILCRESLISKDLNAPEDELSKHCHAHVPDVIKCLNRFVEKLEPCLDNEEKYLKQMLVDGYEKYAQFACEHLNVIITDVFKTNTGKCITHFFEQPKTDPHKVCYGHSKVFGDNVSVHVVTKSELCHDLYSVRSCYEETFNKHCPDAPEIKRFEVGIMKEGLTPCSDVMEEIGTGRSNDATELENHF